MKSALGRLWREHRMLFIAFALAATLTTLFAIRTVVFLIYWANPANRHRPLEPWMTPRYIAYSWEVPIEEVNRMLGARGLNRMRPTLERIARERGIPVEQLMRYLAAELAARDEGRK